MRAIETHLTQADLGDGAKNINNAFISTKICL